MRLFGGVTGLLALVRRRRRASCAPQLAWLVQSGAKHRRRRLVSADSSLANSSGAAAPRAPGNEIAIFKGVRLGVADLNRVHQRLPDPIRPQ